MFVIYTKSNCKYCKLLKELFEGDPESLFINCDEELDQDKEAFLLKMETKIGKAYTTFPMVFYEGDFVGGYSETLQFLKKNWNL